MRKPWGLGCYIWFVFILGYELNEPFYTVVGAYLGSFSCCGNSDGEQGKILHHYYGLVIVEA